MTAVLAGFLWLAIVILIATADPDLDRLADPTPTEAETIREALDAELDALERERDFELWEAQL
jgi:hypothetical protein